MNRQEKARTSASWDLAMLKKFALHYLYVVHICKLEVLTVSIINVNPMAIFLELETTVSYYLRRDLLALFVASVLRCGLY